MPTPPRPDAVVLENVTKHFRKRGRRKEHTTLKSELVRWLTGRGDRTDPDEQIEVLRGVSLRVPAGQTVGIVGRNGSGKSTLLKVMTGIYAPSSGVVQVNGRISALLELGAGFHPDFSGRENILINGIILGMSRAEVKARMSTIIEFAELGDFIDEPVRTYSSGMFMRLAFAVATHVDPEVLIIDEILSVGDEHFQRKSAAKLKEFKASGRTILLVTHSLDSVEQWCDSVVWIDAGVARMAGTPGEVISEYRRAIALAEAESAATGHSALSAPGVALPSLGSGADQTRITQIRLRDGLGSQPSTFNTESRLDVLLDYEVVTPGAYDFTVQLRIHGNLAFRTRYAAGRLERSQGTVRLTIPRLGLGEGTFDVVAAIHPANEPPQKTERARLVVTAATLGLGIVQPEHAWSVEPPSTTSSPGTEAKTHARA